MDLVEFLHARLDEDEQGAPDIHAKNCGAHMEHDWGYEFHPEWCDCGEPARVLADVEAKRRIIAEIAPSMQKAIDRVEEEFLSAWESPSSEDLLRLLALPDAAHPDYQPNWKRRTDLTDNTEENLVALFVAVSNLCNDVNGPHGGGAPCALRDGHELHRDGIGGEWGATPA